MGGDTKISTPGPIKRAPLFPYLRSKVGTVSAASPLLSGKMSEAPSIFLTLIPSSLISLPPAYSKGVTRRGYAAILIMALDLHNLVIKVS
jgi:hypothetical protein